MVVYLLFLTCHQLLIKKINEYVTEGVCLWKRENWRKQEHEGLGKLTLDSGFPSAGAYETVMLIGCMIPVKQRKPWYATRVILRCCEQNYILNPWLLI